MTVSKFFGWWKLFLDRITCRKNKTPESKLHPKHAKNPLVSTLGPYGGVGGGTRNMVADPGSRILKVMIRHGFAIDSISVLSRCNGHDQWTDRWGGGGGQLSEFSLADDEYLTRINGYCGLHGGYVVVRSLAFVSNKRTYGPYGDELGSSFQLDAQGGKIVGFFARSGLYLDAFGVYTAPVSSQ